MARTPPHEQRAYSSSFARLPEHERFEEERYTGYKAQKFLPVGLGQTLNLRYHVVAKLGYGTASTVWLCRDLENDTLATVKVCALGADTSNELAISKHITSITTDHPGRQFLRVALADFCIQGPHGTHQCLVFQPLGRTLASLRDLFKDRALEKSLLQRFLATVIVATDFMHRTGVVHTDLSPNNILVGTTADAVKKVEEAEIASPSPRKILADRTIHLSYAMPTSYSPPVITDFGAARLGLPGDLHRGDIMPAVYRAPEVIADLDWDSKVDIWSIGVMVWDLFESGSLFTPFKNNALDDELHLAEMISLLGPPPPEYLRKARKHRHLWNRDGKWIAQTPIPDQTLESREIRLEGREKELLLGFVRRMLQWLPEQRPSADDLWGDPFLNEVYRET